MDPRSGLNAGYYGAPPQAQSPYPPNNMQSPYGYPAQPSQMSGYPQQPSFQQQQQPPYGQYPPPQGQQHGYYPPQGPPPGQYGGPQMPPAQYGAPPQAPYSAPPQAQYGAQSYGSPPTMPDPPSPGYNLSRLPPIDMTRESNELRKAMKGLGTDEKALIQTLTRISSPLAIAVLNQTYTQQHRRNLLADITSETSGYFRTALQALVRGPLAQDVHLLHDALAGAGTKEVVLNDVLLSRSNADLAAICAAYQHTHHRPLAAAVASDLSAKTATLFSLVLACTRAPESTPIYPDALDRDVRDLYAATTGRGTLGNIGGADQLTVCTILSQRSDGQIRAIASEYKRAHGIELSKVVEKHFSGHMHDALLRMLRSAEDRAMADAVQLEETMKGAGTKDNLLVERVVRVHWQGPEAKAQVKGAYRARFRKELVERVRGETSGDYRKCLEALLV